MEINDGPTGVPNVLAAETRDEQTFSNAENVDSQIHSEGHLIESIVAVSFDCYGHAKHHHLFAEFTF